MLSPTIRAGLFLIVYVVFAQSDRGSITDTIFDPAGTVVVGAAINAINGETGAVYPTLSTTTGNYCLEANRQVGSIYCFFSAAPGPSPPEPGAEPPENNSRPSGSFTVLALATALPSLAR